MCIVQTVAQCQLWYLTATTVFSLRRSSCCCFFVFTEWQRFSRLMVLLFGSVLCVRFVCGWRRCPFSAHRRRRLWRMWQHWCWEHWHFLFLLVPHCRLEQTEPKSTLPPLPVTHCHCHSSRRQLLLRLGFCFQQSVCCIV